MKISASFKDPVWWILAAGYGALICISFLSISTLFHQELTSDQTIHVLMANDFSWKYDLYYWGQNRLGSFLPALSSFFVAFIPAHPLIIVGIIQYLLVIGSFFLLTAEMKNRFLRFSLALMWFLPFPFFAWNVYIGQPYTAQYFLLGLCLLFLKQSEKSAFNVIKKNLLIGLAFLAWMLSAWVNDLMLALFPVFLYYFLKPCFSSENTSQVFVVHLSLPKNFSIRYLLFAFGGTLIGLGFIYYAKGNAYYDGKDPGLFTSFSGGIDTIRLVLKTIYRAATFQVRNVLISFHAVILLLTVIIAFLPVKNQSTETSNSQRNSWLFFLLLSFCSFLLIVFSRWVELNHHDTRYFCPPYYFLLLALGFRICTIGVPLKRNMLILGVFLAAGLSSANSLLHHKGSVYGDGSFSFREQRILAKRLGDCGVIGNYRNSYSISAGDPDKIVSTPHENDHVRNSRCVEAMLKKEKVFLVGNDWLEIFPDTITQFGRVLVRADAPFMAQHLRICEYH